MLVELLDDRRTLLLPDCKELLLRVTLSLNPLQLRDKHQRFIDVPLRELHDP